jgi:ABC-type sugar transport system substrate-binding protein
MPKLMTAGVTALFISVSPLANAQAPAASAAAPDIAAELKAFTDTRIEIVKAALQLTPAQEKFWPALEDAIRARAKSRQARLAALATRVNEDQERSPIEVLRGRADALAQRSADLKKLADAWQPLYPTLDTRQKLRLRFVTVLALREMKDQVASRIFDSEDEDEND